MGLPLKNRKSDKVNIGFCMDLQLPHSTIIEVSGKHAAQYLHNRLSNNIKSLSVKQGCSACALSPTGKIEGLFHILRVTENTFIALSICGEKEKTLAQLKRFLIAEQVQFKDLSQTHTLSLIADDKTWPVKELLSPETFSVIQDKSQAIAKIAEDLTLVLSENKSPLTLTAQDNQLDKLRFLRPFPEIGIDLDSQIIPQECGLSGTISFNKGCYVGQEVVAKIDALGKAPRQLSVIRVNTTPSTPALPIIIKGAESAKQIGKTGLTLNQSTPLIFGMLRAGEVAISGEVYIQDKEDRLIGGEVVWLAPSAL